MTSSLVIHHISDIHVGPDHANPKNDAVKSATDQRIPASRLESYLNYLRQTKRPAPSLVVVSGDLASSGKRDELDRAVALLVEISKLTLEKRRREKIDAAKKQNPERKEQDIEKEVDQQLNTSHKPVCVIPGNHDLDWGGQNYDERITPYRAALSGTDARRYIYALGVESSPCFKISGTNVLVYLLDSCRLGGSLNEELNRVANGLRVLFQAAGMAAGDEKTQPPSVLDIESRLDPGYVSQDDLTEMGERLLEGHEGMFKIAVVHHNPSPMPTSYIDRFNSIINAGAVKKRLDSLGFDLILHGHQHYPLCSYEEVLSPTTPEHTSEIGLYVLGAPSLGSRFQGDAAAGWFELRLEHSANAHIPSTPTSLVEVGRAEFDPPASYRLRLSEYRFSVSKPLTARLKLLHDVLDRPRVWPTEKDKNAREAIDVIMPPLLRLQGQLDDWSDGAAPWQDAFHANLDHMRSIWGTDMLGPTAWLNPKYATYVHQQFEARRRRSTGVRFFSKAIASAITRTKWDSTGPVIVDQGSEGLEIVRILLWHKEQFLGGIARSVLQMIDSLHRLFDVPVFVVSLEDSGLTEGEKQEEFVVASCVWPRKSICQVYSLVERKTSKARIAKPYFRRFLNLLANPKLKTIAQVLA